MTHRSAIVLVLLALTLGACGGSSAKTAAPETSEEHCIKVLEGGSPIDDCQTAATTTTTIAAALACGPQRDDCTSEQVIATVAYLYEKGGATSAEAACLAPITATGKHAVNEAFEAPTAAQTTDAIACVGSESRLRTIATDSAAYVVSHPDG